MSKIPRTCGHVNFLSTCPNCCYEIVCKHCNKKPSCRKCKLENLLQCLIDLSSRKEVIRKYDIFELGFCDDHQSIAIYSNDCFKYIIESHKTPCHFSSCKGVSYKLTTSYYENYVYYKCMSCALRSIIIRLIKCSVSMRERLLIQFGLEKNDRCPHNYIKLFCKDCYPDIC